MIRETKASLSGLILLALTAPAPSLAASANRVTLPDGSTLELARGVGANFDSGKCYAYQQLKGTTLHSSPKVQWSLQDLDTGKFVAGSSDEPDASGKKESDKRFFGASTSKMFVGAALLDQMGGKLNSLQLERMKAMITVSSNEAWRALQRDLGAQRRGRGLCAASESDMACGRQGVADFTRKMAYKNTRGYSGSLHGVHGNELNAKDTNQFLADTYKKKYAGAEVLWNLMQGVRTGAQKAKKYIPSSVTLGGKTGTYDGPTEVMGKKTYVNARNNAITFKGKDGHQYGLTILSNDGRDETVALLAGGIVRQYTGIGQPCGGDNLAQPETSRAVSMRDGATVSR